MPGAKESAEAWERTVDLVVRRVTYSAAAGACAAVVLFRTPGAAPAAVGCACVNEMLTCGAYRSQLRERPRWRSAPAWALAARSPVRCAASLGSSLVRTRSRAPVFSGVLEATHVQKDAGVR